MNSKSQLKRLAIQQAPATTIHLRGFIDCIDHDEWSWTVMRGEQVVADGCERSRAEAQQQIAKHIK